MLVLYDSPKKLQNFDYHSYEKLFLKNVTSENIYFFKEKTNITFRRRIIIKLKNLKTKIFYVIKTRFTISDKIAFVLIIFTLILFFLTSFRQLEVYFVIILITLLSTKELTETVLTTDILKKRLNIFVIVFMMAYSYVIIQKILYT
jgi:hypothetical protein